VQQNNTDKITGYDNKFNEPSEEILDEVNTDIPVQSKNLGPMITRTSDKMKLTDEKECLQVSELNLYYGDKQALMDISMIIPEKRVTAFIGPSGCGKSTLLRCFNRMNDLIDNVRIEGQMLLNGEDSGTAPAGRYGFPETEPVSKNHL
jgi:ABC-type bacteriocin/lantibiotic exporter with double-glycine peptidase domain